MGSGRNKLMIVAALLLGAGALYAVSGRSRVALPDRIEFVCVATGEIFALHRDDIPSILPARNPRTGAATLVPIARRDGRRIAAPRCAALLADLREVNRYVDPNTLEIRGR